MKQKVRRLFSSILVIIMMIVIASDVSPVASAANLPVQESLQAFVPFLQEVVKAMTSSNAETKDGFVRLVKMVTSDDARRVIDGIDAAYNNPLVVGRIGDISLIHSDNTATLALDGYVLILELRLNISIYGAGDKQFGRIAVLDGNAEHGKAYVLQQQGASGIKTDDGAWLLSDNWRYYAAEYRNGVAYKTTANLIGKHIDTKYETIEYIEYAESYPLSSWDELRGDLYPINITPPAKSQTELLPEAVQAYSAVRNLDMAYGYTGAVDADGNLWMWGSTRSNLPEYAFLGNGSLSNSSVIPVKILDNVASVSFGDNHAAAIKADGSLWTWGNNFYGQLGNGGVGNEKDIYDRYYQTVPVKIMENVESVYCTAFNTLIKKIDNSLWITGGFIDTDYNVPVKIMDDVSFVSVDEYGLHVAVIKTDGSLWTFGDNRSGTLGDGTFKTTHKPVKIMNDVKFVSSGSSAMAAIKTDGSLWTWGGNFYGELGNGGVGNEKDPAWGGAGYCQTLPVKIMNDVSFVLFGGDYCAAIKEDRTLWMWGACFNGVVGNGNTNGNAKNINNNPIQTVPVKIMDNVISFRGSDIDNHMLAIKDDYSLWLWGGQAKTFYFSDDIVSTPMKVLDNVVTAYSGNGIAAIKTDGTLWTWGNNTYETLGYSGGDQRYKDVVIISFQENYNPDPRDRYPIIQTTPRQISGLKMSLPSASTSAPQHTPSVWAQSEVSSAVSVGLVPENLQKDYTKAVSRGDVAQMFINLIEKVSGKAIDAIIAEKGVTVDTGVFSDTSDKAVLAANALGIINGVGNNRFAPNDTFTRAQIAAIINRVAYVMGVNTAGYSHDFVDIKGHWVDSELGWPVHAGIINGIGNNRFDPDSSLTIEQAIAITYRALKSLR